MFTPFDKETQEIELPKQFTYPFNYIPHKAAQIACQRLSESIDNIEAWREEVSKGKMFGVLVVKREDGCLGYLSAFSGNILGSNNFDGFVPPIYDMLSPSSFFKCEELNISLINKRVKQMESDKLFVEAREKLESYRCQATEEIEAAKRAMKEAKARRDLMRKSKADPSQLEALIKESQYQKAELKRVQQRHRETLKELEDVFQSYNNDILALKRERKQLSALLQERLFREFVVVNIRGERRDMIEIFSTTAIGFPPAGSGECAAPKLLQYAFLNNLQPICMAEFWRGESPRGEVRIDGSYYPSCLGKCKPILEFMLMGMEVEQDPLLELCTKDMTLDIIYQDDLLMVVNKPSGMLSVPGKSGAPSAESILKEMLSSEDIYIVHRLDMATSGLLIVAKNINSYIELQRMFASREVSKSYEAIVEGEVNEQEGVISLPLALDYLNRPRQRVDFKEGKEAVTRYEVIGRDGSKTRLRLYPLTGRTHQLRMHCAHQMGLGCPIVGDNLYAALRADKTPHQRMCLHARTIEFTYPTSKKRIYLEAKTDF